MACNRAVSLSVVLAGFTVCAPVAAHAQSINFRQLAPAPVFRLAQSANAAAPAATPNAGSQDPTPVAQPMPAGGGRVFNPDMSVIANFLATTGKNPMNTAPSMSLNEVEVALQAVVDPYARADFYLSATPEGLEVEEGYLTFTTLPGHFLMKVGKMRAQFGKVNTLHTHSLPYADRPLVSKNLVGGEEGMSDSGVSVSRLLATPALFLEATGEVYAGQTDVFQSAQRSKLAYVGRLRGYRDLTEGTNIDFGGSVAFGPTNVGAESNKTLYGVDVTFRYRPLRRAIYKRFQARTELIWSRQDGPVTSALPQKAFGWYGLTEYQFARRWYIGGRYDRSGRTEDALSIDKGFSAFITMWPSEFSQIRGQYRHTSYAEGIKGNEFLVQFNFSIGAHGAHVF